MKKILFGSAALLIAAGAYFNLRMSETWREKLQVSELTLKNLEAMGCDGSGVECDIFPDCKGEVGPLGNGCSASVICSNGATITCWGHESCVAGTDTWGNKFVLCDGGQSHADCH